MITRRQCLTAASALLAAGNLRAQTTYPSRTITLLVPGPAGVPSDSNARRLQPLMQRSLGQTVIVENVGGAGGTLGAAKAVQQPADGHTVMLATPTELVLSPLTIPNVRYQAEDFSMIGHFGRVPYVLCCRPALAATTVPELLALAARASAPLTIGHIGPGSLIHLMGLDLERAAGLKLNFVPYRGVPMIIQDAMGGQLDLCFLPLAGSIAAQLEQGKLRTLAVTSATPSRLLPQLPTMASTDPRLARFHYDVWGGLFVRSETPEPVQARLHAWWSETANEAEFLAYMRSTGSDPVPVLPLAEARSFYTNEVARYRGLLKAFPDALRS